MLTIDGSFVLLEHGRMGEDHSYHATDSRGHIKPGVPSLDSKPHECNILPALYIRMT